MQITFGHLLSSSANKIYSMQVKAKPLTRLPKWLVATIPIPFLTEIISLVNFLQLNHRINHFFPWKWRILQCFMRCPVRIIPSIE